MVPMVCLAMVFMMGGPLRMGRRRHWIARRFLPPGGQTDQQRDGDQNLLHLRVLRIAPRNGTYLGSKITVLLFLEEIFRGRLEMVGEFGTPGQNLWEA